MKSTLLAGLVLVVSLAGTAQAQISFSGAGPNAAGIQATVDQFRAALGTLNPNVAGSFGSGRREINWDGVPDALAAPNNLPANFFNVNSPRGVIFSTPGSGFQVSADTSSPSGAPVEFGNINPTYPQQFATFSPERLFTALGSTITDVSFFIPGSNTGALTNGFGAVFTDVDLANVSSLQFFDAANASLGTFFVPNIAGSETLSFLGVAFPDAIVSRVRITSGNQILAPGSALNDLVVMDDFIYGEPQLAAVATPETGSTILLLGVSTALLGVAARRRRGARRSSQLLG